MLVTIGGYIFQITDNLSGFNKDISINIDKQQTLTRPVYTALGGYEESISFEAMIILENQANFLGFESLVKKAEPLPIIAFDMVDFGEKIIIEKLSISVEHFCKAWMFGEWYYTKTMSIQGYLIHD